MQKILPFGGAALLCLVLTVSHAQSVDSVTGKVLSFPSRLLGRLQKKTTDLNNQLTQQTESYLQKMARREAKMQSKLAVVDSNAAKSLFAGSAEQYAALQQKMRTDTGHAGQSFSGAYPAYLDSLQGSVAFLKQNPQLVNGTSASQANQLQGAGSQLQALQAKMGIADEAKAYMQQRKQMIADYIAQHSNLQGLLGSAAAGMNKDVFYYSQTLRQYQEMWSSPDKLEQETLTLLTRFPAFQTFMKSNSMLGGLFNVPSGYSTPQAVAGLQTKDQIAALIQQQTGVTNQAGAPGAAAGGGAGAADGSNSAGTDALQSNLQSAQSQLDTYKSKLSQLGGGNGNMDMPNFNPNDQKTKTFWKRIEYGANFQTSRNNYYFPTVTDFGFSLGYKLGHNNIIGVGASYKLGWGNGIQHIAFSNEGIGLRSFLQIKIKGTFSATGGFEYNYTTPFTSYQQIKQLEYWTRSGLIGVTKTVSMKNRLFKSTSLSLLWDFLSYQQIPQTQPFVFRIGYTF
jgi:hypothetical protein